MTEANDQLEKALAENSQLRETVRKIERELEIEAALEKVRAVALTMTDCSDMMNICQTIADQLGILGFNQTRNVQTAIFNEGKGVYTNYEYYVRHNILLTTEADYKNHPLQKAFAQQMLAGAGNFFENHLHGKEVQDWYEYQKTTTQFPDSYLETAESLCYYWFSIGPVALGISTYKALDQEEIELFKRFRNVFELAYKRFLDIQRAVEQAREARIEAALERVRGRTLAMHKSDELAEVAILLFKQVEELGIKTWTAGFNVWNDDNESFVDYITTPQGGLLDPYTVQTSWTAATREMGEARKSGTDFIVQYLDGEKLKETYVALSSGPNKKQFEKMLRDGMEYPSHQYDHLVFGRKVSLMFITYEPVPEAHDIFKRFGKVFEQTYTRYLDLQNAETQLSELKSAQAQLIQSEKMASLGELTAGIAHEIQNPLNFVNNFSEVNAELSDEILVSLEKGDLAEAKALAANIKINQEKIREHGQRADGIVKSMLQHSRTSVGEKELHDVNILASEYLRLSYHGTRAKDKEFIADYEFTGDPEVPLIHIIPQDLGRVLLNLINNAFYAVNERRKKETEYRPKVTVATHKGDGTVKIIISDNGIGVSEKLKEKIFQPFFTTKPTGEGTGLGLSLSYDIITKGHGGAIHVESNEAGGSDFIIELPAR